MPHVAAGVKPELAKHPGIATNRPRPLAWRGLFATH